MIGFKRTRASRPLLFERLIAPARDALDGQADPGPPRLHDEKALRASIEHELADLLNTRAPVPIETLEQRTRTAIDYGIPDLSAFPIGEHAAMERLKQHVRSAILAYEPRLRDPAVEIVRGGQNAESLTVLVRGTTEGGAMHDMPMTFKLQ
jgi:type VI secretion system protein ImpF